MQPFINPIYVFQFLSKNVTNCFDEYYICLLIQLEMGMNVLHGLDLGITDVVAMENGEL